jgi:hypothetical protein
LNSARCRKIRSSKFTVDGTTTAAPTGWNDSHIFSEYVEGSSFNKALEIANLQEQWLIYLFIP